jgi:hypothetical protein
MKNHCTEEANYQDAQVSCLNEFILKEDLVESISYQSNLDNKQEDTVREGFRNFLLGHYVALRKRLLFFESPLTFPYSQRCHLTIQVLLLSLKSVPLN